MLAVGVGRPFWLLRAALLFSFISLVANAHAAQPERSGNSLAKPTVSLQAHPLQARRTLASDGKIPSGLPVTGKRGASRAHGISCVPYARQVSGIKVVGNAWQWWKKAEGHYARGDQPEVGSVLNFRSNGRMRLGHVAVVMQLVNPREIIVDQANWPSPVSRGNISHDVAVVDVSEANNWSAVRVELGRSGRFGSVYPTYGFIYNRPDTGIVAANVARPAPQPAINPVPSDLRPVAERSWHTRVEVAELPAGNRRTGSRSGSRAAFPAR